MEKPEHKNTILVVDDHEDIIAVLTMMLEQEGYRVQSASGSLKALKILGQETPDLIILDIRMPEINGLEFLKRLKADPKTSSVPVMLVTARIQYQEVLAGYNAKADHYLTKPFTKTQITTAVQFLLQK